MILKPPILRDYQGSSLKKISAAVKEGYRVIMLKLATGSGKTVIACQVLYNCLVGDKKAMIMCDRIELINQTSDTLLKYGIDHGVIQGEHERQNFKKNIQVSSVQTMARRNWIVVDVLLIDEAHTLHRTHIRYIEWLLKINPKVLIIGLSATPFTRGLGKVFQKCITVVSVQELIDMGFLCKPTVFAPSAPDLELINTVRGDYKLDELEEAVNKPKLVGDIIDHWFKLGFGKPTICFATSINHSKAIVDEFKKRGIRAEHLDAYTDDQERKNIIKAFRDGAIQVLSSVDILSKGFDVPSAEVAILARPTKSLSLYIQQAGRVLRISPETGKTGCLILDHAGNTERLGFVTDDTTEELDKGDKKQSIALKKKKDAPVACKCPSCDMVKQTAICSNCGFEFKPKNTVVHADGYLVEITPIDLDNPLGGSNTTSVKDLLLKDLPSLYGQLKQYRLDKNYKNGWEYFTYKDLVGAEPSYQVKNAALKPVSVQLVNYLKHLQIRKAKSKYRKAA